MVACFCYSHCSCHGSLFCVLLLFVASSSSSSSCSFSSGAVVAAAAAAAAVVVVVVELVERSLEVKLPTIRKDEKAEAKRVREEKRRRGKIREQKE